MQKKLQQRKQGGFTIIEVLIVLAIAGLIMVVVFVAVPQLQRNQRNSARNSDANLITSAVSECLSNRNGVITSCDTAAEVVFPTNLKELTTAPTYGAGTGSSSAATWVFGVTCNADGTGTGPGTARQFVVRFQSENSAGGTVSKCISS